MGKNVVSCSTFLPYCVFHADIVAFKLEIQIFSQDIFLFWCQPYLLISSVSFQIFIKSQMK